MKKLFLAALTAAFLYFTPTPASAQINVIVPGGGTLPAVCNSGALFRKTGSGAGLYICQTTNTFQLVGSSTAGTATNTQVLYNNAGTAGGFGTWDGTILTVNKILSTLGFTSPAATSVAGTTSNACGTTSPTLGTGSSNSAGTITVGATSGTSCTLTFSQAAAHFWACGVSDTSTAVLVRAVPLSTTTTKFLGVLTAADVLQYSCSAF